MSLISIVMPAFNADKYIKQALDSMINQTYRDIQIVVINDGSTDHTAEILHQYQKIDSRIEILHIENQGCSVAMNHGVEYASGDYIARMDADDISVINRLEIQLAYIKSNALDLCGSAVDAFYKGAQIRWNYPLTENEIRTQLLFNSPFAHPTIMAKAEVLKKIHIVQGMLPQKIIHCGPNWLEGNIALLIAVKHCLNTGYIKIRFQQHCKIAST